MGEIKNRDDLQKQLNSLDNLNKQLQNLYSGGNRATLQVQITQKRERSELLDKARRHQAWRHEKAIRQLESDLGRLPREVLQELGDEVRKFGMDNERLSENKRRLAEKKTATRNY